MVATIILIMTTIAFVVYLLRKETDLLGKRYDVEYETDITQGAGYVVWTYLWWADCLVAMVLSFVREDFRGGDICLIWIGSTLLYAALVAAWSVIRKEKIAALYSINRVHRPEDIIRALGGEIQKKRSIENDTGYEFLIVFQGGNFLLTFRKDTRWVELVYPNFSSCKYAFLNESLLLANYLNNKQNDWTCCLDVQGNLGKEEILEFNLSAHLALTGSLVQIKQNLHTLLEKAFYIARHCNANLEQEIRRKEEQIEKEKENEKFIINTSTNGRLASVINQMEARHTYDLSAENQSDTFGFSVQSFVRLYDNNSDFGCLLSLKIIHEDTMEYITDISSITTFDVRKYICQYSEPMVLDSIVLIYEFECQELFVNLTKAKGCTDKTLYYVVNVVQSGSELDKFMDNRIASSNRTMLEIRLDNDDKERWEVKYMIDDAMDKMANGKENELTDEQLLVVAHTNPTIQTDLYWGKKYFNNRCYYQSLYHFNRVYRAFLSKPLDEWGEELKALFFDVSYYIGFIYADLGMNDRAFYYLNIARASNRIDYIQEFANCFCNMKDPSALGMVTAYIKDIQDKMNNDESEMDRLMPMYEFFQRRYAYLLIEYHKWDEAENLLNMMIERDMDVDFACGELEYIRKMRENEDVK